MLVVTLEKLMAYLETIAPLSLAEDYDNVGLLVGDRQAKVSRVLVSLDTDADVVAEAAEQGCELILSHHPLLFHPVRHILYDEAAGETLRRLVGGGMALYACHTNLDAAEGGLCDYLLQKMGITDIRHSLTDAARRDGIGRVAVLERAMTLGDLMEQIRDALSLPSLRYVGDPDELVQTVGICNGGGGDLVEDAYRMGCDLYISGDLKHHHGRFAYENNLALLELTHYDAEICFCDLMRELLTGRFEVDVMKSVRERDVWRRYQ